MDDGRIIGIGDYKGRMTIDLHGAYLTPSLIDGHFQVESSMLTAAEFARAVVRGVATTRMYSIGKIGPSARLVT